MPTPRMGHTTSKNEKDLIEVPEIVKKGLNFIFVDNLDEVFEHALQ